jgi:hypothetical protein
LQPCDFSVQGSADGVLASLQVDHGLLADAALPNSTSAAALRLLRLPGLVMAFHEQLIDVKMRNALNPKAGYACVRTTCAVPDKSDADGPHGEYSLDRKAQFAYDGNVLK